MLLKKMSHGWRVVDFGAVQCLSTPPMMGADSVIRQLIYIHSTVCELAVKCLFYLSKSLTLSLSSSSQLKMSLAFCITFWWRFFFFMYTLLKFHQSLIVVQQTERCLQVLVWNLTDNAYGSCVAVFPSDLCCWLTKLNSTTQVVYISPVMP